MSASPRVEIRSSEVEIAIDRRVFHLWGEEVDARWATGRAYQSQAEAPARLSCSR
jgi:hypothetical protein